MKFLKDKKYLTLALSSAIFILIYLLSFLLYPLDKIFQDNYYKFRQGFLNAKADSNIVVVEIDEKTLASLWRFPFDRTTYIPVIENLNKAWVSVIWVDIIFPDFSDKLSDLKLSRAIKKAWNIVLWYSLQKNNNERTREQELKVVKPLALFDDNKFYAGLLNPIVDRKTQKVYEVRPFNKIKSDEIEYFWIALVKAFYAKLFEDNSIIEQKWIYTDAYYSAIPSRDIEIPLARPTDNRVLVNYLKLPKEKNKANYEYFKTLSFIDVYNNNIEEDLTDKIIIIWATAEWIKDDFFTPVWYINWVYVHANFVNTMLTKNYLVYFNNILEWWVIFLLILLAVYLNLGTSGKYLFLSNIWIVILFGLIYPIIIFTPLVLNYSVELFLWAFLAIITTNIIKYITEDKRKTKLMKALSEYVSKDIAQKVLETTWSINLEWEKKEITIFFSDIEGFTTISENLSPESLVHFLRFYLWEMSDVILDEQGFINKYEWDAIMALWWTFWEVENHSTKACIAALKQKVKLKSLNTKFVADGYWEIRVRMWLHKWEAIIWNIWSEWRKMEFTALWDSVNLASRLEWVNKNYWTEICVSDDVFTENQDKFEFRYLDKIRVKWKNKAVNIYELIALKNTLSPEQSQIITDFRRAIDLYYAKKFEQAQKIFEILRDLWDKPSITYVERCKKYLENPPWEDWDFVWTYDYK